MIWAQLTLLAIHFLNLGADLSQWGKMTKTWKRGWVDVVGTSIAITLLYCAGALDKVIP